MCEARESEGAKQTLVMVRYKEGLLFEPGAYMRT